MSLSDLASLGSFVSGIAVLISLVYLALQVRQAEKNQRAIIHQGRTAQATDRLLRAAEPAIIRSILKMTLGREPNPDEIDFQQYLLQVSATCREMQDVFFQHDIGLLDEGALNNQLAGLRAVLVSTSGKAAWRSLKDAYDPQFAERVDAMDRIMPVAPVGWAFERYKAELAKIARGTGG